MRTTDEFDAYKRANRYWVQVREAEEQQIILAPKNNFKSLARQWLDYRDRVSSATATRTMKYQFTNYLLPYFGQWNVGNITERAYIQFLNKHRLLKDKCPAMRKRPTLRTLAVEQQNLLSFLNWCFREGKMRVRVDMRKIVNNEWWIQDSSLVDYDKPQRRDKATKEVYEVFRRYTRDVKVLRPRDTKEPEHVEMSRRRAHFYILTVYNFVCRPGDECLKLRFGDLTAMESEMQEGSYWVVMRTKYGKKVNKRKLSGPRELIYHSDYNYFGYLKTWIEFLRSKDYPTGHDDFVFPVRKVKDRTYVHYGSMASARYLRGIKPKVKEWCRTKRQDGLTTDLDTEIEMFSMYSVRHIAIRNLIVESEYDFSRVAERANTGVSMIEDFYYKYSIQPEQRGLVSRHPTPDPRNTKYYDDQVVSVVDSVIDVIDVEGRAKSKQHIPKAKGRKQ